MSASACFGAGIGQKNRVTDAAGDRGKDAQAVVKPEPVKPKEDPVWRMGLALVRDGQNSDVLGKLNRYEGFIQRVYQNAANDLGSPGDGERT